MISVLKSCDSAQRKYIRRIISAQSWASVPPAPDWMSRNALLLSSSPENMRRNSSPSTCCSKPARSDTSSSTVSLSSSSTASSSRSFASESPDCQCVQHCNHLFELLPAPGRGPGHDRVRSRHPVVRARAGPRSGDPPFRHSQRYPLNALIRSLRSEIGVPDLSGFHWACKLYRKDARC